MQGSSDTDLTIGVPNETSTTERRRDIPAANAETPGTPIQTGSSEGADVGATVLAEARALIDDRRFGDAVRVLDAAERLRPNDPQVLALIAVASAHSRNRGRVRDALRRLSTEFGAESLTWRTVSDVALARFQFDPAQKAARTAVQLSARSVRSWHSLAASYAGNGWFEEAGKCLEEARKLDPVGHHRADQTEALSFGQWQIGRAVNYWAITRSYVILLAMVGVLYLGLLGLALALSAPMLLREIRVRQLPDPLRTLADLAWRAEHRLRVLNGVVVMGVLVAWVAVFSISR